MNPPKIRVIAYVAVFLAGCAAWLAWQTCALLEEMHAAIAANPVVQQQLGEVVEIETDMLATGDHEDPNLFVFRVVGTEADGVVEGIFITQADGRESLSDGRLQLSSGQTFRLIDG